ncbi:PilN domain-containing protein [Moraxella sp. ZY200743]|uniref:PilN domain-containing protein n=1 Tax=Moraxella sp. ZY200743 TaxID=2911970 RepID=UPI003D7C58BE
MNTIPKINLLPWRQLRQLKQNEQFRRWLLAALALSLFAVFGTYVYHKQNLNHQQAINDDILARMGMLDAQIASIATLESEQEALLQQAKLVYDLGKNRVAMVRLFEHLSLSSHGLVYFDGVSHAGGVLTITGHAKDAAMVSQFTQRFQQTDNPVISDVLVTSLSKQSDGWVGFVLSAKLDLAGVSSEESLGQMASSELMESLP